MREKLIENMMTEADRYGFDGINLDFESLKTAAGVHYIEFIRELSVSCRKKGLVLSVDNYVPAVYNRFYNQKEQGNVADYVIIMGYDEHYAGGEARFCFFDRICRKRHQRYAFPGSEGKGNQRSSVLHKALDGKRRQCVLPCDGNLRGDKMGVGERMDLTWDDSAGQYYGRLDSQNGEQQLWMEETRSLGLKMDLIKKYDLAGVAGWRLGLETSDVWDVIGWE